MPVLIDDDLLFEEGQRARATVVINRWLREPPSLGVLRPGPAGLDVLSDGTRAQQLKYRQAQVLFDEVVRHKRVNLARRRQAKRHVSLKYLDAGFTDLFVKGPAGLAPDGNEDAYYRGRTLARNAAVTGRITDEERARNEQAIRAAMDRILSGRLRPGRRCDLKTLAQEAGNFEGGCSPPRASVTPT
ncbi:hypothetical protein [Streptomyces mirabilis]